MSMLSAQVDELRELATRYDELQVGAVKAVTMPSDMGSILREAADTIWELRDSVHRERAEADRLREVVADGELHAREILAENAKLLEQIERLQPTDSDGNVLDIADTVHMLRSEYDGDHEWDDVIVELTLTKWGGDRWIVRGSKGEAWACDCTKTGYDEDAFEDSDDVEPFDDATLAEVENAKLRKLVRDMHALATDYGVCVRYPYCSAWDEKLAVAEKQMRELGVDE